MDNIFNMDETFILVYPGKDKVLLQKGPWFQLKKTKRESHWQSQLVFFLHNFFPPFIIDTGSFGADLMTSWSNYTKSTVIFNKSHWMTQYAFIIYLDWLLKMFPCQRSLLIVDRSKTHFGKIITDWLETNHSSPGPGKVFLVYILEGMTSIHQVCDIALNKPLKAAIKKLFYDFRQKAIADKTARELVGCALTVPREDLVGMIETAFDEINLGNKPRRWIAAAFATCGQDPWSANLNSFEKHLASFTGIQYSRIR